jgi:CxxC motif-containing protein (DUF1111 family)
MRVTRLATTVATILCMAAAARGDFGDPLPGVSKAEHDTFTNGRTAFATAETPAEGLGPVFNDVSCVACHAGPGNAVGGNTTRTEIRFGKTVGGVFDPLLALGGSLIQTQGIGHVGVLDTPQCAQVSFAGETVPSPPANVQAQRRTTPLFGLGLVDATPDDTFKQLAADQLRKTPATAGTVNLVPQVEAQQQNLVGRFGWKAQNATLHVFAGDAYLNEMGVTNPTFPNENCPQGDCSNLACLAAPEPNDDGGDVDAFAGFMTFLAPPPPGPPPHDSAGEQAFRRIGCADCHTPTLTTGPNASAALDRVTYHPYSDFLLHDMGGLGDGITQGNATGTLMRTAPLWGLRTQTTLLHDGRATTVTDAIHAHDGQAAAARAAFDALNAVQRGKLLDFLGSL